MLAALDGSVARREALDERLSRLAQDPRLWPTVARLRCFRGVDTLTALALHLELGGDWARFSTPPKLGSWLGLTPSLNQSGESSNSGSITKTGSSFARRLLVESAWHYMRPPRIGVTLQNRQQGQPDHALQIAWRAQHRLYRVHHKMRDRGKPHTSPPSPSPANSPASSGPPPPHHDLTRHPQRTGLGLLGRATGHRHARLPYEQPQGGHARS